MSDYLYYGLMVILAIVIIYFVLHWYNHGSLPSAPFSGAVERMKDSMKQTYDSYMTSQEDLYEQTTGHINDEAAQMALGKASKEEQMYERQENLGTLSAKNMPVAAANAFLVADLNRYNVAPNTDTTEDRTTAERTAANAYAAAMRRIAANPIGAITATRTNTHMPPAEFMIDRVENFYEDYVARMTMGTENMAPPPNLPNLVDLRNLVRAARLQNAQDAVAAGTEPMRPRRKKKKGVTQTEKQAVQDNYFEDRDIRNDPQNVHESQVNNDMFRIYRHIMHRNQMEDTLFDYEQTGANPPTIDEIREYAKRHKFSDSQKRKRAMKTINKMAEGNWISKLNARENEILVNVWKRTTSPENENNKDNLRGAVMDSLSDCVETGYNGQEYQVCASGRTGRLLSSLTLLDADDNISEPIKTAEVLRNEVFAKSYQIIQDALKETDVETARAYNGVLESPAPDVKQRVNEFEADLKNRIENNLRTEYADKVEDKILTNLISDAQAGV